MRCSRIVRLAAFLSALAITACDPAPQPEPLTPTAGTVSSPPTSVASAPAPSAIASAPIEPPPMIAPPSAEETARMAKGANGFGLALHRKLGDGLSNQVFSPLGISAALAMTWAGARGETASNMQQVLGLEGTQADVAPAFGRLVNALQDPARPVTLRIANRLFGQASYPFEQPFLDLTRDAYGAPLQKLDFVADPDAARVKINGWVEERTDKHIKDLLPPNSLNKDTRLTLVNAIYFFGAWETAFSDKATNDADFFVFKGKAKKVPTMHRTHRYRFAQRDGLKALELPYKGGSTSMLLVLPSAVDGLAALEKSMTAAKLEGLTSALDDKRVEVSLPRFEIRRSHPTPLQVPLRDVGLTLALSRDKADFTGIANPPAGAERLFIDKAFHLAHVKVDEKGTEAAAATGVVMGTKNGAPPEKAVEFKADHPFLFFVRDVESGLILFMGRVSDPSAG